MTRILRMEGTDGGEKPRIARRTRMKGKFENQNPCDPRYPRFTPLPFFVLFVLFVLFVSFVVPPSLRKP